MENSHLCARIGAAHECRVLGTLRAAGARSAMLNLKVKCSPMAHGNCVRNEKNARHVVPSAPMCLRAAEWRNWTGSAAGPRMRLEGCCRRPNGALWRIYGEPLPDAAAGGSKSCRPVWRQTQEIVVPN
jgi:hypothetical protein